MPRLPQALLEKLLAEDVPPHPRYTGREGGYPLGRRYARGTYPPKGLWSDIRSLIGKDGTLIPGKYIFAVDYEGKMYLAKDRISVHTADGSIYSANHGALLGGENAYGAGEVTVGLDGKVQKIIDATGHYYQPGITAKELLQYPKAIFEQLGLWKSDSQTYSWSTQKPFLLDK